MARAPKKDEQAKPPLDPEIEARLKAERIEREKEQLLQAIAATITDDVKTKVGYVLSHYPDARDSDVTLAHRVWQTFYPQFIDSSDRVHLDDMFQLPRQTTLTRWRAKIQNEYRLYQPSEEVSDFRRSLRDDTEKRIVAAKPGPPVIMVHADESGKNQQYLVVGSVWLTDVARIWRIVDDLREWQKAQGIKSELKFASLSRDKLDDAMAFVRKAMEYSDVMSLKACTLDTALVRGRAQEEIVFGLYCELALSGIKHEVTTGRVSLPRSLSIVKDADAGPDALALPAVERRLADTCLEHFDGDVRVEEVMAAPSHESPLLQLADLFAGSIARALNTGDARNPKDDFAAFLATVAGFDLATGEPERSSDFAYVRHLR